MKEKAHSINHGFDGGCHGVTISSGFPAAPASHGSQLLLAFTAAKQRPPWAHCSTPLYKRDKWRLALGSKG